MSPLRLGFCLALSTGVLSGCWAWLAETLQLASWIGFLGCTTYFAIPHKGLGGLLRGMAANISGALWAAGAILLAAPAGSMLGGILTGLISFAMCVQARLPLLGFIPGSFMGACAMFGSSDNGVAVVEALILGGIMGFLMQTSGQWLATSQYLALKRQ
ncbi:Inner membrane protein YcdZ [Serratia grimesii]|jgi:hypothetical protein|uniref:DUF1097 domain-containing protein n=1 Tax=Serratia grimesii TaxID=82995 RepID=UPI00076F3D7F|nr:DUF1097 domain-containing protein [Serratia grimesii]CAI0718842.1 Inner membrane protein ycdZ [Serratia grimesii]CAI2442380.1 Inner membrane protein ycdZ [Serratia grimesii]CUW13546.1 Inner membrane protein YcdZ [Serratia grimesii]SMZ56373.1 Inner membrane protein YcdZ [Serratia grimesii]SUI32760.1 Inner membrane protein ycdZ [Serratia grimesii]